MPLALEHRQRETSPVLSWPTGASTTGASTTGAPTTGAPATAADEAEAEIGEKIEAIRQLPGMGGSIRSLIVGGQ
jgi:hypothetical protein